MRYAALLVAIGCGSAPIGHSGIATDTAVVDLTPDEALKLCEYIKGLPEQPEREVDCGNGQIVTVGIDPEDVDAAIQRCVEDIATLDASCMATVGETERCYEDSANATDEVICSPELIASCLPVARCS